MAAIAGIAQLRIRGSTFEIPITVNNAPEVGTTSVSAPRDITRGGSIPIGAALQGGNDRLNDSSNHIFTVKACDNGNNGVTDTFSISIDANYSASGTLKNGNINIHEK